MLAPQIEPPAMRALILHMIQLDPSSRLSAKDYLTTWGPNLFPEYFTSFLQPFCHTLLPLSADLRLAAVQQAFPQMLHFMAQGAVTTPKDHPGTETPQSQLPSPSEQPAQSDSVGRGTETATEAGTASSSKSGSAAVTRPSSANRSLAAGKSLEHHPCR